MVLRAEALVSSGHLEVLPQLLALSFRIKSPFGVSGSVLSRQAKPTSARGAFWINLSRTVTEVERVKFDLALLQNPELTGVEYQRGELLGWEIRSYLLEKFGRQCAYCRISAVPFELDHQLPRSRGGSNRVSNLVLSCHDCNLAKGDKTAAEWGHPEVTSQARAPLRDAAAVNTTRYALVEALKTLGLPIGTWSGGRTRWNRNRFGIMKTHCLDALCVGDLVRAEVPGHLKTGGVHLGRVVVRASGSFRVGTMDGINARYCRVVQRLDGYDYTFQ
jgi:5-methylcytosine-specific restriction endonuclease McrA